MYYTYMLRCNDGSIYSGIASDLVKRMKIHFHGGSGEAKYVVSKGAERLEAFWISGNKSEASKLEYRLKKLSRTEKENLICEKCEIDYYFSEKLDCSVYIRGNVAEGILNEFVRR